MRNGTGRGKFFLNYRAKKRTKRVNNDVGVVGELRLAGVSKGIPKIFLGNEINVEKYNFHEIA